MTKDQIGPDPFRLPSEDHELPPLDIQAFLHGDLQGRQYVLSGDDRDAVREFVKAWRMPEQEYFKRRNVREAKQHRIVGSCPTCGAEGSPYSLPYGDDWIVCSAGCQVRWLFGAGFFSEPEMLDLPEEELREITQKLFRDYSEVKPLMGWKAEELTIDPREADVGISIARLHEVGACAICGFDAIPEDLRNLAKYRLLGTLDGGCWGHLLPVLSLAPWAPLCMVCSEEVDSRLQEVVNTMWGLAKRAARPW